MTYLARQQLFGEVKEAQVPFSREHALLFSQNIALEADEEFSQRLVVYDDGREPIDVLYDFAIEHSIEQRFNSLAAALLPKLCEHVVCTRDKPTIWKKPISNESGNHLGTLSILLGDEPIDAIDAFVQRIDVASVPNPIVFRQNLLEAVCGSVNCTRTTPVVYRKSIKNERGQHIGDMEILENQEVIDAAFQFIQKSGSVADEIALKNYMLQNACKNPRVRCTRNVAVVFSRIFKRENGSRFDPLTIYENEEPADKVYKFCQNENSLEYYDGIIGIVCDSDGVKCSRREPVYFSISITGADGDYVDTFQIKVNEEPVDA